MMSAQRRRDRRLAAGILAVYAAAALAIVACTPRADVQPDQFAEPITDARVCAATAVYTLATGDDWGQRAVIANAVLNQYAAGGPDCRRPLDAALSSDFDVLRWQQALDAVDAVASGSYALPPGCIRANRVVPTPLWSGAVGPALHCSMGGLSFLEVRR